jgi:hypothetical protein
MYYPKKLFWRKDGRDLSLSEVLETTDFITTDYVVNGIEVQDLDSSEILQGVKEFWNWVSGTDKYRVSTEKLQDVFWTQLKNWNRFDEFHDYMNERTRVSNNWLKSRTKDFFDLS